MGILLFLLDYNKRRLPSGEDGSLAEAARKCENCQFRVLSFLRNHFGEVVKAPVKTGGV